MPSGLDNAVGDPAPAGIFNDGDEPVLPTGLGGAPEFGQQDPADTPQELPFEMSGFWEARYGRRIHQDPLQKQTSVSEARMQLDLSKWAEDLYGRPAFRFTGDFVYDHVEDDHAVRLDSGRGWFELRQLSVRLTPVHWMDVVLGRQTLTWGTGDLIFINDLFPKDWVSFFIGRDVEYLKAPTDAAKFSFFSSALNADIVYVPRFDADRFITGRRLSYWNGRMGRTVGRDAVVDAAEPDDWFEDDEAAFRLYRNVGSNEIAFYGYDGFWKSPGGMDPVSRQATFPRLRVLGASMRGNVFRGIGSIETAYYDSRDDRDGGDPLVRNSEIRLLLGYEREAARNLTVGIQYYIEFMQDYSDYVDTLPPGADPADEDRHVITLRLTKLLMDQNLTVSLFTFYSPTDQDLYLRPAVHYKISDTWAVEAGGNLLAGRHRHTFFNQFHDNSNIFAGLRLSF